MKKLLSLILSFTVLLGLSIPAFAEDTSEQYVHLDFGDMIYDSDKESNEAWFGVHILGEYIDVDRFIIHFTINKELFTPGLYAGSAFR